ncbi:MAG TPA: pyridoxamine 5'-phosphate oxidase family protein [Candidatus Monoglobus merdigallinarum]|uniref:Pyridoxamine 5'-phosphate oxidase family protein n=1 Tax=Candidatus Monoglobus merdigallinarum TaxID=2838698 RepID=A0A9D1PRB0_9FIRM|nr:pyridoxamine 5'-phosphate oxidase family protein [Candidatus Monoglobus merdigallinarum]
MRRKDREVTDINEIKDILSKAEVLRLALNNGEYPYILPVNFGFKADGEKITLFFHGSNKGTKHDIIKNDAHAAFEVDCGHMLIKPSGDISCTASYTYESVIGHGVVKKASDEEKGPLLSALLHHYGLPASNLSPEHLKNTTVYKIEVKSCTAKRRKA